MPKLTLCLMFTAAAAGSFLAGHWSASNKSVLADSEGNPQIEIRPVGGDSSLTVFYPGMNKLFVYQNPFVGLPTWNCAYSIQLSTPGGKIERQPCPNPGQRF
jgi:hypothetical protein